jgi:hypothetical protein
MDTSRYLDHLICNRGHQTEVSRSIGQVSRNQWQRNATVIFFYAIRIDSTGPTIANSIGWYFLSGHRSVCPQTPQ